MAEQLPTGLLHRAHPLLIAGVGGLLAGLFVAAPSFGEGARIHDGITANDLAAFARGEGWTVEAISSGQIVQIRIDGASAYIQLLECDEAKLCKAGVIRTITYHFLSPDSTHAWHWNLQNPGATMYGPHYVTLERYVHFTGVTDRYLRDVIGRIWPDALRRFHDQLDRTRQETKR